MTIPGAYLLPDAERTGVVINIAELRLYYYPEVAEGETPRVETYPIGIGRDGYDTPQIPRPLCAWRTRPGIRRVPCARRPPSAVTRLLRWYRRSRQSPSGEHASCSISRVT